MSTKDPAKKPVKDTKAAWWDSSVTKDISGLGWTADSVNSSIPASVSSTGVVKTPNTTLGTPVSTLASNYVSPQDQAKMTAALQNPMQAKAASGPIAAATGFLASLFDFTDTQDNPVEWAWDGMWRSLGWGYDRINQGASWAVSAAPGGVQTFNWDQAGQISYGQASLAAGAKNVQEQGGLVGSAMNFITSPFSLLGGFLAGTNAAGPLGDKNFDITDAGMRKAAFQDSTVGKWASGLSDAVFTTFADPLLFAGKAAKVSKLKYLDDIFQGEGGTARLKTQMVESLAKPMAEKAPIAQFAARTAEVDPVTGKKILSSGQIAQRLRGATGSETISAALHSNKDEEIAQLIIRHGFGDPEAAAELMVKRPSLAMPIAREQRQAVMSILDRSPSQRKILMDHAAEAEAKIAKLLETATKGTPEYNNLLKSKQQAQRTFAAIDNGTLGQLDDMSDPTLQGLLKSELNDQIANDPSLQKFLLDEQMRINTTNIFAGSKSGFSVDNAFGRRVEQSRMNRSNAGYEIAASRGQKYGTGKMITLKGGNQIEEMKRVNNPLTARGWTKDQFGRGGISKTVNIWRWLGEENPSGFINTKGAAAMGSWKELNAVLNDVPTYSGDARKIIIDGEEKFVGGRNRREQLIDMYMESLHSSTAGAESAQVALSKIEDLIFSDIAQWHGMSKKAAEELQNHAMTQRKQITDNIKDVGFWIDEDNTKNVAPWLESQLQNGTYMINYKQLDKQLRMHSESDSLQKWDKRGEFFGQNAKDFYDAFNEVWRPSVLLRLGYTQRNVMEGLFRASAYTFSLDPLRYAAVQTLKNTPANVYSHITFGKTLRSAEAAATLRKAGKSNVLMPKDYIKWLDREISARDADIAKYNQFVQQPGRFIEDVNSESRDFMLDFYRSQENHLQAKIERAKAAGADTEELKNLADELTAAVDNKIRVSKITKFQLDDYQKQVNKIQKSRKMSADDKAKAISELDSGNSELLTASNAVLDDMQLMRSTLEDSMRRRMELDNETSALSAFRQQGAAKMRVHNGTIIAPDGTVLRAAFNKDSDYTNVALSNLSADATTRSMSVSASNSMSNALRIHRMKNYVNVQPGDENYFNGVASALRQVKYSEIGQMAINGSSVEDIAKFLHTDASGKQILEFIVNGENRQLRETYAARKIKDPKIELPDAALFRPDYDQALQIAQQTIDRYQILAPSPELQNYMKTMIPDDSFNGDFVKNYLDKKNINGEAVYALKPVIGHISEELGSASIRESINTITSTGMKWLGTFPEDALVRAPFYGKRYKDSLLEMIGTLQSSIGKDAKITMRQYNELEKQAHLRALKDTKEWMFTIERRTNLGTYGEIAIPFISATQNSVTTVGRLLWNDPSVAVLMTNLWGAPGQMDLTDDKGMIHIPIPHDWIPDNVENLLGITNQLDLTFSPSQLNLIASQLDNGTLFQFGPTVAVPAGFLMEHNFLIGPDAPALLTTAFGQDMANSIWSVMKDHTFGPNGSPSLDLAKQLLPATVNRALEIFQGEGNERYAKTYYANYVTEHLKWRAGLRAEDPKPDEITAMTNNLTLVKLIGNAFSPFPPSYESTLQPFVDEYIAIKNDPVQGKDADRIFMEKYGTDFLAAANLGMTKSVVNSAEGMVSKANRYESLIKTVSPELQKLGDLSALSMLFSSNANDVFDGSIYAWQKANAIPGVSTMYRESLTPEEAWFNNAINVGWAKFTQFSNQLDARAASMGYSSASKVPSLQAEKTTFVSQMKNDPMYSGWFEVYNEHSGSMAKSSVALMTTALNDSVFAEDHKDDPIWQAASEYLNRRNQVIAAMDARGGGSITSIKNRDLANWWDKCRSDLKNINGWDTFANRFLSADDDPKNPGVSYGIVISGG